MQKLSEGVNRGCWNCVKFHCGLYEMEAQAPEQHANANAKSLIDSSAIHPLDVWI